MKGLIKWQKDLHKEAYICRNVPVSAEFFAFILSAAGALADPVGKLVYNNVFTNKIDFLFTPDIFAYVNTYGLSCALAIFSLVVFSHLQEQRARKSLTAHSQAFLSFPACCDDNKGHNDILCYGKRSLLKRYNNGL